MKYNSRTIIEITDRSIKFMQAPLKKDTQLSFMQHISFESLTDDIVTNFLTNIQKSQKHLSLRSSEIILIIPRQHIILRYLNLPSENPDELKSMVDLQASQELPFNREEVVIDFIVLDKSGGFSKVLMIAVLGEVVMRFIRMLDASGIKSTRIVPSFIGMWQWQKSFGQSIDGVSVLLDVDTYQSEICICDQNRVFSSRPTNLGLKELRSMQYDEFLKQIDWTIAGYVKEQLGLTPQEINLIAVSDEIVSELFTQMKSQYNMALNLVLPFKQVMVNPSFVWPSSIMEQGNSCTAAFGLLFSKHPISVDLTPMEIRSKEILQASRREGFHLIIAVIIAFLSIGFCFSLKFIQKNKYLEGIDEKVRETQKKVAVINHKVRQINYLKSTLKNRIVLIDLVDELYRLLPKELVLTNLSLSQEHQLSFQGYTSRVSDVNELQRGLVASSRFDNVNLDYVNKRISSEGELNYFKITCHIKMDKGMGNEEIQ